MYKNILNLIQKYNEYGFFIKYKYDVYWCNAKRLEYWYRLADRYTEIITWQGELYLKYKGYFYKNNLTSYCPFFQGINEKMVVIKTQQYKMVNGQINGIVKKSPNNGYKILAVGNEIYAFSAFRNEKFNVLTNTWSDFADIDTEDVFLYNDKIYGISYNIIYFYNTIIDQWFPILTINKKKD